MDLATLVTEGMELIGRGDLLPETDEYPVIWTPLQTDLPALLPEVKGGLLDILTEEPAPLFYPGSPALRQTDNGAELVGCFSHNAVSGAEPFVQALDQFVRLCQQCHTLILRG